MITSPSRSIGVLAQQTGCTVPMIRYYEEVGLLPHGPRTAAGRRVYGDAAVRRLTFIRRCRDFGFTIEQVRELVGLVDEPDRPCTEIREVALRHLNHLQAKLAELQALEASLSAFVRTCDASCVGGAVIDCTILEDLAVPVSASNARPRTDCCSGKSV